MSVADTFKLQPSTQLQGSFRVASDKSISHRSVMFSAIAEGTSHVTGFLEGEDSLATLGAFQAMGVKVEHPQSGELVVHGVGLHGLKQPDGALYLGNSGTSMRLLSGLLAGQNFPLTLTGDKSLSSRPMRRVTIPLQQMGAEVHSNEQGTPPLEITPSKGLHGFHYALPVASAQVKSCLLLAGLYAEGETCLIEPAPTRDHTERMLRSFSVDVQTDGNQICLQGGATLKACDIQVPADISSAAFFMVGACIAKQGDVTLTEVGINPTRTGIIDILKLMGAEIEILNPRQAGAEPVADLRIKSSQLKGIDIPEELVPLAIDEFPAVFVAAACAEGQTRLTGAEELRVKESDRIQVMAEGLQALGIDARPTPDGMIIQGGQIQGGKVDSHGDHRIAMSFAMASLRASGEITITDCANVATSFPDFIELANNAGLHIDI